MKNKLYIATIEVSCIPKNLKGRWQPVKVKKDLQPLILDSDTFRIPVDNLDAEIKRFLRYKDNNQWKERVKDMSRYIVKYEISNVKFSSEIYEGANKNLL